MADEYLIVKNFEKFQHYKSRESIPAWIKLHRSILTDYEFQALPDTSKAHLMMIWLLVSQRNDRRIPENALWIAQKIGANEPVNLANLIESGWLIRLDRFSKAHRPRLDQTRLDQTRGDKRAARALPIPANFELDDKDQRFAKDRSVDASREFPEFRAFHEGKGDVMIDWHAAWRTWVLRSAKWASQRSPSPNGNGHRGPNDDRPMPPPVSEIISRWKNGN